MPLLQSVDTLDIKYRPKIFNDLVGQDKIVKIIKGMLKEKKIDRTIMLYGPTGSGKTTIAEMIARYINCTGEKYNCGKCYTCTCDDITEHTDVHEMNMAYATSVEDVKKLINSARYMPRTNFRIFILDELHQCFPGYVHVMVDYDKSVSIKEIYENPNITHVLSYDIKNKRIEKRKIINKFKRNFKGKLSKLYLSKESYLPATPNHNIFDKCNDKIEISKLKMNTNLIQYDGEFDRFRVCKYCGELVEIKYYFKHTGEMHGVETRARYTSILCNMCGKNNSSKIDFYNHIIDDHIPKKFHNMFKRKNKVNFSRFGINSNMNFDDIDRFLYFLKTGFKKCPYCSFTSKSLQAHVFWKHRNEDTIRKSKIKSRDSAYNRYQTEKGIEFKSDLSKNRRGKNNPFYKDKTNDEIENAKKIISKRFKNYWDSLDKEEREKRISIFQNAPIYSGKNKVESLIDNLDISNLEYTGNGSYYTTLKTKFCNLDNCNSKCKIKNNNSVYRKNPDFIYCPKKCSTCKFYKKCEFNKTNVCDNYIRSKDFRTNKVIEIMDFEYWHCIKEAEILRESYKEAGINALFIDSKSIYKDLNKVRSEIESFLNNSNDSSVFKLKKSKVVDMSVYNLEIEGNHNYFTISGKYKHNKQWKLFDNKGNKPILVANCSKSAKECLLKPLEKPNPNCIWILCTTEPDKFKTSILGRCTKLQVNPVKPKDLFVRLKKVAMLEKSIIHKDDASLMRIAELVNGQPREGLKALGIAIHYLNGHGKIDVSNIKVIVNKIIDLDYFSRVKEYLLSVYEGNLANALLKIKELKETGNCDNFIKEAIEYHNNALYYQAKKSLWNFNYVYKEWIAQKEKRKANLSMDIMCIISSEMTKTLSEIKNYSVESHTLAIAMTCKLVKLIYTIKNKEVNI